jgi:hypothetical protein
MKVTLYVADRRINQMMKAADLCDSGKVFVAPLAVEINRQGKDSTKAFLERIVKTPSSDESYWIPAVSAEGEMVITDGINQLSDGDKILFVGRGQ